jgi:MFS family permease
LTASHHKLLLPLLFVGVLMGALDLAIIGPALPAIQAEFGMTERQLSVLFNAYVLCQMIGTPVIGKFADRVGARLSYMVSIGLFAAGSLLLVVASEPAALYFGRALQGFGGGGIFPVAAVVIANSVAPRERGPALGVLGTVFGLAFLVGPVMGGLLLPYGWHWLFLVNIPIAAVLMLGATRLLPAGGARKQQPLDMAGIVTLAVLLSALVYGLNGIDTGALGASLGAWPTAAALLGAAALVPVFWRVEKRAADPLVRPALLRSAPIVTASLIGSGIGAIQAAGTFYPALAVAAIGVSQGVASWMLLPGVVVATAASPVAGRLINRVGNRAVVGWSLVLVAVSVLMFGVLPMTVATFIAAGMIGSAGMGGVLGAPLRLLVLDNCEAGERGAAQGLLSNFTSVGRLFGAAFVGSIAASAGGGPAGYQAAFTAMAVLAAVLVGLAVSMRVPGPGSPEAPPGTAPADRTAVTQNS